MPFADLLGVQMDMHMLGKLTVSVAAVLLISLAYKFYSSRRGTPREDPIGPSNGQPSITPEATGLCSHCRTELRLPNKASPEGTDGKKPLKQGDSSTESEALLDDGLNAQMEIDKDSLVDHLRVTAKEEIEAMDSVKEHDTAVDNLVFSADDNGKQKIFKPLNVLNLKKVKEEAKDVFNKEVAKFVKSDLSHLSSAWPPPPKVEAAEYVKGCSLSPPSTDWSPADPSQVSPTGRPRSPCLLRKLEPNTEIGRELRQDLGGPSSFSTFQSKAAVVVGDGDLLLERPGDRFVEVRGKIYDYYVESSSESIFNGQARAGISTSGSNRAVKDGNTSRDLQLTQVNKNSSSSESASLSPPLSSPLIMRDIVFLPESAKDSPSPINRSPSPFRQPQLVRKDSYQQITENSELQIPLSIPRASTPVDTLYRSQSTSENLSSNPGSPTEDPTPFSDSIEPSLEKVAGINFLQMPKDGFGISELEHLQGKLDLGNCLQALSLARKYGHVTLQQAALKIMSDNYFHVLRDPELYGKLKAGDRAQIQKQRMRGKQYLTVADIDSQDCMSNRYHSGETDQPKVSSKIYYYDDYRDTWITLCALPREVVSKGCAICTMDNYIFIAVGCEGTDKNFKPSRRVFCYNPVTSIWKEICPMNEARPQCKLVALQGYVYAIGGECLSTVERYDPRVDRWSYVSPLPNDTFAVAHRATACHGELFVSGGTLRYTLLRYNPKANVWRQSFIVGCKERTTEMVAVRNFLYRFDISPSLGISVYRYHTVARLWYECCSRRFKDCLSFQCTVLGDVIYCINRQFNMRFLADEVSPTFVAEDLNILSAAKGMLFPFVLTIPDKEAVQTRV